MESKSINIVNNQSYNQLSFNNNTCGSLLSNIDCFNINNENSWLNCALKSFNTNRHISFESSLINLNINNSDEISKIFQLIDLGHFYIQSINRENEIIKNIIDFDYKSIINFHKVKEIDSIKLLTVIIEETECEVRNLLTKDSCFIKEVSIRLQELDDIIKDCFFSQISDIEVTETFALSSYLVDNILNDCEVDLLELESVICKIYKDWKKKEQKSRFSKSRNNRLSQKIIDSLQNDVIKNMRVIGFILERLFSGCSNNIINIPCFKVTQDFLLDFQAEIDEKQYQNIVSLKHFHLELEQKTLNQLLELKESQLLLFSNEAVDNFNCKLSPIKNVPVLHCTPINRKNPTILASTPYLDSHKADYDDLISESDGFSVLSMDSGILPMSENDMSLTTSRDTIDVIPFLDEEYEKINNDDPEYKKRESKICEDSDCFGSTSTNSEKEINNSQSAICFTPEATSQTDDSIINNKSQLTKRNLYNNPFENYNEVINSFHISSRDKDIIIKKMLNLLRDHDTAVMFNCALSVTLYVAKDGRFDDLELVLAHLEEKFFDFMKLNEIREMPIRNIEKVNLDIQENNNACSPNYNKKFIQEFNSQNDKNTNNNADSKEDEGTDRNATSINHVDNMSIYADTNFQLAYINETTHSSSSELISNNIPIKSNITDINNNVFGPPTSDAQWHQYDVLVAKKSYEMDHKYLDDSLILEDIDLALRLSELHLKCEFEKETCENEVLKKTKTQIIKNYKDTTENVKNKIREVNGDCDFIGDIEDHRIPTPNCSAEYLEDVNDKCQDQFCDTLEDIDDELKTELFNISENNSSNQGLSENLPHDNETLSFSQRIKLTITLTERLLSLTRNRLELLSLLVKKKDENFGQKIFADKAMSIYLIRQRLGITGRVLSNLKYAIMSSRPTDDGHDFISQVDKLIEDSQCLRNFLTKLEDWQNKSGFPIDENTINVDYLRDLPDDLLVKLENIDMDSIVSFSIQRLHVTISALAHYPCYDSLMRSSLKKFIILHKPIVPSNIVCNKPPTNSELIQEIHKLRRITAICALNIVDLHVITANIDEKNTFGEVHEKICILKELLLFWRVVDKECHRLLRCNSLIQHILLDSRRTYVELVSLTAVIISIIRTINLSPSETTVLNDHMNNINNYKLRIIEWLEEIAVCSSVIHKKRITNKRFKFYEDIHNYLEENLKSISELADHIKLGCQKTVKSLTSILTYCSDLSGNSLTKIDEALNSNNIIDNHYLYNCIGGNSRMNEGMISVMVDLEMTENDVSHFQELLDQSKKMLLIIIGEDKLSLVPENRNVYKEISQWKTQDLEQNNEETNIIEKATRILVENISAIATYAASNALLLFIDKNSAGEMTDVDTDQQISNWTTISENEDVLNGAVEFIVDDITAMLTASLLKNIGFSEDDNTIISCKLIFYNICYQLGDKALHFLVENIMLERRKVDNGFICETCSDLTDYFTEELSYLMINNCVNTLSKFDDFPKKSSCIGTCVLKLQQKLSHRLLKRSATYIADLVGSYIDTSLSDLNINPEDVTEDLHDLPSPISTYRLSKKIPQQLFKAEEILTKISKIFETDVLLSNKYSCDIRKCKLNRQSNVRIITSDKISKLVEKFDRGVLEREILRDRIADRLCCNSVQIKSNEIIKEVINDIIQDIKVHNNVSETDDDSCGEYELTQPFVGVTVNCANSSNISNISHATEVSEIKIENCNDLKTHLATHLQSKSLLKLHNSVKRGDISSLKERYLSSVNENVTLRGGEDILLDVPRINTLENEKYHSIGMENKFEEEITSVSLDSDTKRFNRFLNNSSVVKNTNDPIKDSEFVTSELTCVNNAEIVEEIAFKNEMSLQRSLIDEETRKTGIIDCNNIVKTRLPSIKKQTTIQVSSNSQNVVLSDSKKCLEEKNRENRVVDSVPVRYEEALSKLWLFVCLSIVIVLGLYFFFDHINRVCHCLNGAPSLLSKRVSSALPF